jgi:hypothetical protein
MVDRYEVLFAGVQIEEPLAPMQLSVRGRPRRVVMAPWCVWAKRGLYHDHLAKWWMSPCFPAVRAVLEDGRAVDVEQLIHVGLNDADVNQLLKDGYLIPE